MAELYALFGGYDGYEAAPVNVAIRQELRLYAKWEAEAKQRQQQEQEAELRRLAHGSR